MSSESEEGLDAVRRRALRAAVAYALTCVLLVGVYRYVHEDAAVVAFLLLLMGPLLIAIAFALTLDA